MKIGLLVDITENWREKLRHAVSLGFDRGQIAIWDMSFYTDENAKLLKEYLEEIGFTPTDLWCGWSEPVKWNYPDKYTTLGLVPKEHRERRLQDLLEGGRFAHKLGIKNVVSHTGFIPDNPFAEEHIGVVESLKVLCSELKERGQTFSFETGEELPVTLSQMIIEIGLDNVGVNFDPANLLAGGRGNPNDALALLSSKIFGVHAKDSVPPKFGETGGHQVLIGTGGVDFERLFRQLKDAGYDGDVSIEHEMYSENRDRDIIESRKYLEEIISRVYGDN